MYLFLKINIIIFLNQTHKTVVYEFRTIIFTIYILHILLVYLEHIQVDNVFFSNFQFTYLLNLVFFLTTFENSRHHVLLCILNKTYSIMENKILYVSIGWRLNLNIDKYHFFSIFYLQYALKIISLYWLRKTRKIIIYLFEVQANMFTYSRLNLNYRWTVE